ncbi:endonuclease III [Candidatus Woesearchaeota archaeon]|nr:endonuclease III [Candidatus Woesearchaeota archaeon]
MKDIEKVIKTLSKEIRKFKTPIVTEFSFTKSPYKVLISCLLSLRTKDEVTSKASYSLFNVADTAERMIKLSEKQIQELIYPVGFYRTKARRIIEISKTIINNYNGKVPDEIDELLKLKGVGRKTANLVVSLGYSKPGICVDTHVHRISNRLGWVRTKTPHETEFALRKLIPVKYWSLINELFVRYGQNLCKPVSPYCSICKIRNYCKRAGILSSR